MSSISNKKLVQFLRSRQKATGLIDTWKTIYRPYICPFNDLLGYANAQSRVLDIGCGQGQFVLLMAEFVGPLAVAGVEISDNLIRNAWKLLDGYTKNTIVHFQNCEGGRIPEFISLHDLVYLIDVFHHIPKEVQKAYMHNLYHLMAPGSRLILKDIDASHPLVFANKLHDLILSGGMGHELRFSKVLELLQEAGFRILTTKKRRMFWYPHYTIEAVK